MDYAGRTTFEFPIRASCTPGFIEIITGPLFLDPGLFKSPGKSEKAFAMHRWERATLNGSGNAKRPIDKPQEQLSTALWLLEHTQSIVTTATAIGILHLRTCHALYFTIGSLATSFTAKGLKKVIKQPRPPGSRVKKTSGMPSTHSA
uniref:Dolichyl pyrophosphate phosphatase and related acid phosphatases n=1 Tax=Melanopsichium pennsylvanicum 4 TaxID=1398559 RepID=A0A077QY86_9BASI|nr:dolichyl pyrophosphate phosphatase and related acid phosphatases [Melanopsichium pennsylvanicum 4]